MQKVVFDEKKLWNFMRNFNIATGIHIGVHDIQRDVVLEGEWQGKGFCAVCRRICNDFRVMICEAADKERLSRADSTLERQIYNCPCGFTEAIIPVTEDETVIFCFFIGRVHCGEWGDADFNEKMKIADSISELYALPENRLRLRREYDEITRCTPEQFIAICDLLELCARSLYEKRAVRRGESSVFETFRHFYSIMKFDPDVSAAKIARAMGISESALTRCLKQHTGMSFLKYETRDKTETAKKLLLSGDMKIKEVAAAVGVSDANYFSRLFKKETGMTCEEFRAAHGD